MVLKEFRINHSTLIEHYQFIEAHLEGIYAALSGKSFADGIREIEKDKRTELYNKNRKFSPCGIFVVDFYLIM